MLKFHHYSLEVDNLSESIKFYKDVLGFQEAERIEFEEEEIQFLTLGDFKLELIKAAAAYNRTESIHICFETENFYEILARFENYKIKPVEGPYTLKNGWKTVFFSGPSNDLIEILSRNN